MQSYAEGVLMTEIDQSIHVGYCGIYCNACGIRQGKIREAVNSLRDLIASFGFDKIMPDLANWEPSFKHYDEFEQVMSGLLRLFGDCPGCLQDGGDPNCKVRSCARQKGYRTCTGCPEAKICQKIEPYRKYFESASQSIKQKGIKKYAEEMQRKVENGYILPGQNQ